MQTSSKEGKKVLLRVSNLKQYFPLKKKGLFVKANDGITLDIYEGETFGLVGESRLRQVHAGPHAAPALSPDGRPDDVLRPHAGRSRAALTSKRRCKRSTSAAKSGTS